MIRVLASGGEGAAAELVAKLGAKAEIARELAYRLYTLVRTQEARGRSAGLQRPRPELAGDHPPRSARAASPRPSRAACSGRPRSSRWRSPTRSVSARRWTCSATGLAPFVEREFKSQHQAQAADAARRYFGDDRTVGKKPIAEWDVAALLKLMWEAWNDVFGRTLGPRRTLAGAGTARLSEQVGAPGAVLERRRRPRARLDGAAAHRRLGDRRPTKSAR